MLDNTELRGVAQFNRESIVLPLERRRKNKIIILKIAIEECLSTFKEFIKIKINLLAGNM